MLTLQEKDKKYKRNENWLMLNDKIMLDPSLVTKDNNIL